MTPEQGQSSPLIVELNTITPFPQEQTGKDQEENSGIYNYNISFETPGIGTGSITIEETDPFEYSDRPNTLPLGNILLELTTDEAGQLISKIDPCEIAISIKPPNLEVAESVVVELITNPGTPDEKIWRGKKEIEIYKGQPEYVLCYAWEDPNKTKEQSPVVSLFPNRPDLHKKLGLRIKI